MTLEELGQNTGFTKGYLSMIENGKTEKSPSFETLQKIEKGLGVPDSTLLKEAGYIVIDPVVDDYEKASYLTDLYYRSVIKWSEDQFFNEKDTIAIREHFSDLLLRYKQLVEALGYAKDRWEYNKESYKTLYEDRLSEEEIKEMFLKNELEAKLKDLTVWIEQFPHRIARNID